MQVLYLEWNSYGNTFMQRAFAENGIQVVVLPLDRKKESTRHSEALAEKLVLAITRGKYDFVFSFQYFPVAAMACKACRVKYVSWVYDSPCIQMFSKTIDFETNEVFVFDQEAVWELKTAYQKSMQLELSEEEIGQLLPHVHYLPMAADTVYYDTFHANQSFAADIAFVGSTYQEPRQYMFHYLEKLDDYTKGFLQGAMEMQKKVYGVKMLETILHEDILQNMQKVCPVEAHGDGIEDVKWSFANYFLYRKITAMERQELLTQLAESYQVKLYTYEQTPQLKHVINCGPVDYYDTAPEVYKSSKINLNITLRSIGSGIPLRAFDIMGCGGFLMTNYQEDFLQFFEPDKDYVYYENPEDLNEKAAYYLSHDTEREQIARHGYEKVRAEHTYKVRVQQMLSVIFTSQEE